MRCPHRVDEQSSGLVGQSGKHFGSLALCTNVLTLVFMDLLNKGANRRLVKNKTPSLIFVTALPEYNLRKSFSDRV